MTLAESINKNLPKLKAIRTGKNNTPADMKVQPRKMDFIIDADVPKYWAGGDPVKTHFFNAVSTLLPMGEAFFIEKFRQQTHRISDPELQVMCRKFCGQEGHHAREHKVYNDYLAKQYKQIPALEARLISVRNWISSRGDDNIDLALIASAEHITSAMGNALLRDVEKWLEDDNVFSSMLVWHAVEEVEHKSVAHDIYENICGDYSKRIALMPLIIGVVAGSIGINQLYMLHVDGELRKPTTWISLAKLYLGKGSVTEAIFNKEFWKFIRPDYHPWQLDDRHLVKVWEEKHDAKEDMRSVKLTEVIAA
ncbi:hypothetical protein A9Q81_27510 [Gammaproteobacteria bacterium 42_54_T18]|nr:hypothetical protein A9Q81_27510 [Gammaproteobacteria bacterium 42_54_T18]